MNRPAFHPRLPSATEIRRSVHLLVRRRGGNSMFCERCSPMTRRLIYDPAAEPHAELMSGSCMWPDEISHDWCIECIWKSREWFHVRYQLTVGEPVTAEALERWGQLEHEFPNWPLFRPD